MHSARLDCPPTPPALPARPQERPFAKPLRKVMVGVLLSVLGCEPGGAALDGGRADGGLPDGGDPAPDAGCAEPDRDGDGHSAVACDGDDCDDDDANRFPGNPERCDSLGHDEDCDDTSLGRDLDGDGSPSIDCCGPDPEGGTVCGIDCDDGAATVNPTAIESCNGTDDDCNGVIDEGVLLTFYRDVDGDGFGVLTETTEACTAPSGSVLVPGDCDDARADTHPGATDTCDGVDNDCVTPADPGCGCTQGDTTVCGRTPVSCGVVVGSCTSAGAFDCPSGLVHGDESEACNGVDDNCNGATDEGVRLTFYRDVDGDGFGNGASSITACTQPSGYVTNASDCNDGNAAAKPGGTPNCNMGGDLNCNSIPDSSEWTPARAPAIRHSWFTGCNGRQCAGLGTCEVAAPNTAYRHDTDGDGACAAPDDSFCSGFPLGGEWKVATSCRAGADDCNDGASYNFPGNPEVVDGRDNNCNGACEDGLGSWVYSLHNPGDRADNMLSGVASEAGWYARTVFFTYNSPNGYTVSQPMVRCVLPGGRHYITQGP
ncbi:MAG: putative metal-binding motif-containing protein [Sandaracinaceae bacterium]|nr:putative metal-binding motif-containing protein [Sandaracinaceae bacterium]